MNNKYFLRMGEIFGGLRGFIISAVSALFGTGLRAAELNVTTVADPAWFCLLSPILQTVAWTVAITAGIFTIIKALRDLKRKRK
jgi:hypothetical protein